MDTTLIGFIVGIICLLCPMAYLSIVKRSKNKLKDKSENQDILDKLTLRAYASESEIDSSISIEQITEYLSPEINSEFFERI